MVELHKIQNDGQHILVCFDPNPLGLSKREHEKLCIRKMLMLLGENPVDLAHEASGKPFLKGSEFKLSYSHSGPFFALILSPQECGIDIQKYGKPLEKGRTYFCNANEDCFISEKDLYLIWGAKEAVYKSFGGNFVNPAEEIRVVQINRTHDRILVAINGQQVQCAFKEFSEYFFVYL